MRGRVMALYSVVFLGSTPIGGPLAGWLSQTYDPRFALLLAAISGLSAAWAARVCFARISARSESAQTQARSGSGLTLAGGARRYVLERGERGSAGHSPLLSGGPPLPAPNP